MQSIVALIALLGIAIAVQPPRHIYNDYQDYFPYPRYPFPYFPKRFDGPRHKDDVYRSDYMIDRLAESNHHHQKNAEYLNEHLKNFEDTVDKHHDLHLSNVEKLNSEIEEHNQQISSLHEIIKELQSEVSSSHQQVLDEKQKNVALQRVFVRLFSLYQQLHQKLISLHEQIGAQYQSQIQNYQDVMQRMHNKIDSEAKAAEENEKDGEEDIVRFDISKLAKDSLVKTVASSSQVPESAFTAAPATELPTTSFAGLTSDATEVPEEHRFTEVTESYV
ncbi:hypothetical protein L596_014406 [Steinernema carpocapsae]|uniref:SXP/RAL-2 family protein Ani s 5-like cation-binding domain-containing protein n=1 Tax=Steinernema carpocapsae TaxID=34508 RepID=A0A4U5NBU4_STECR|nr:hypothetical protein L596_014406 [Steinernema carpocapsae]